MRQKVRLRLVSPTQYDWHSVGMQIIKEKTSPYDKALSLYLYLVSNIKYDKAKRTHKGDTAWQSKKGVCQAFCELFYRIGLSIGLDVRIIFGKSKNPDGTVKVDSAHCWIVVNRSTMIDRQMLMPEYITYIESEDQKFSFPYTRGLTAQNSIIIDPTWGACSYEYNKDELLTWFDVAPELFVLSHLPEHKKDQLLGSYAITEETFLRTPYIDPGVEKYGIEPEGFLKYLIYHNTPLPGIYPGLGDYVELEDMPIEGVLSSVGSYSISVRKKKECSFAIILNDNVDRDDQRSSQWQRRGNQFTITFQPKTKGRLTLSLLKARESNQYTSILEYKVI